MKRQGLLSLTGILLLVLLALLTLHEWERVVPDGRPASPAGQPPPMLQLSGVTSRSFGKQGELEFRLDAGHLDWLEKEGMSRVTQPQLWLPLADGDWQIEADSGTMKERKGLIILNGNVVATRHSNLPMNLQTDILHYMAHSERVVTPGQVMIRTDHGSIAAGAMEADLRAQVLSFSQGVETRYVPAP